MIMVFAMIGALWGIGAAMKAPRRDRWIMTGVLLAVVIGLHLYLPDGHPFRENTGSDARLWLLIAGFGVVVFLYRVGLRKLKNAVKDAQQASGPSHTPNAENQPTFREAELDRYARHIVLREIGGVGQKALKNAKVLIIGAGGLGSPVGLYLAASGVGVIGIIDDDTVEASNLQRQIIHNDAALGEPKVHSAMDRIVELNPFVGVKPFNRRLTADVAAELFVDYDVIVDGTDSYATRIIANTAAVETGKPLVSGALGSWDGQVTVFDPSVRGGCYQCLFPDAPDPANDTSCAASGVAAPLPGIIGSMMAGEVVKLITGAGDPLVGRMMMYDALHSDARVLSLKANPDCPTCSMKQKKD